MNRSTAFLLGMSLSCTPGFCQDIQRIDPTLGELIDTNNRVERVATGFNKWTEGPVWTRAQSLLFAEIPGNSIIEWRPGQPAKVFLHPSGYKGATPFAGPEPGSNGMTLDSTGRLTVAGHAQRDVWRMEKLDPKAAITILADSFEGKRLNSPNDLVYKSDGSLYFTDPPYGLPTQRDDDPQKKLRSMACIVSAKLATSPRVRHRIQHGCNYSSRIFRSRMASRLSRRKGVVRQQFRSA